MRGLLSQVELLVFLTMKTFNRKGLKTPGTNPDLKFRKTVPPDLMRVATWRLALNPFVSAVSYVCSEIARRVRYFFFIPTAAGYRFLSSYLWSFLQWLLYSWWVHTYFVPPQFRFKRAELSHLYGIYITCSLTVTSLTTATHLGSRIYSPLLTCFLCQ